MPFNFKNTETTYQRAINIIFHDWIDQIVEVYIDDIVVKSKFRAEHWADLEITLMRKYNFKMKPLKCKLGF